MRVMFHNSDKRGLDTNPNPRCLLRCNHLPHNACPMGRSDIKKGLPHKTASETDFFCKLGDIRCLLFLLPDFTGLKTSNLNRVNTWNLWSLQPSAQITSVLLFRKSWVRGTEPWGLSVRGRTGRDCCFCFCSSLFYAPYLGALKETIQELIPPHITFPMTFAGWKRYLLFVYNIKKKAWHIIGGQWVSGEPITDMKHMLHKLPHPQW